jgi:predicted transcriptional regulator
MEEERPHLYLKGTVEDVMSKSPATIHEEEELAVLLELFKKHSFHGFPVVDAEGKIVGIVRDTDVISIFARKEPASMVYEKVKDIMYSPPLVIKSTETIQKAILKMFADQTRFEVVIGRDKSIVGVVTRTDLVKGIYWKE